MYTQARTSIRAQLMRLSLIIVAVSIALSLSGTMYLALRGEQEALDSNLLNSASILSQVPLVRQALQGELPADQLADYLDATTEQTSDIDLILVGDIHSTLLYVPDRALIGTTYSGTAQTGVLSGSSPYTSNETGPMGSDHSAYAPVRDEQGNVIGFVIVGVYFRSMALVAVGTVTRMLLVGLAAAVLGSLLALRLSRRIKQSLLGYEPDIFARQFHQREDILDALEEGILAIDGEKTVIFLNASAAEMLSLDRRAILGRPLHEVYPRSTLDRVLETGQAEYNVSMTSLRDIRVLSDRLPLYENGRLAGAVSIFRNRT